MKRILKSFVLMLAMLVVPIIANAEEIYGDVNGDLEVNIADINVIIDIILDGSDFTAAADVNGDEEINIADINAIIDIILGSGYDGENEGGIVEPTEMELMLSQLTADEEDAQITTYSYVDSLEYDVLAKEVITLFAPNDSDEVDVQSYKGVLRSQSEDELAQDAIRNNSINRFESSLTIEQQDWDSGLWGKTHYGGFETYFNTHVKNGKRCLLVVFYYKGGFPNSKTAYLKIGQVNCGRIAGKIRINAGTEYAFFNVQIDDYLSSHGIVNFFPLVITNDSKARNYLNPITVKTKPLIDENWNNYYFGYEFGTINNTSVYYNKGKNQSIDDDATYQCVELCRRYITNQYPFINRPYRSRWGDAKQWPTKRIEDEEEYGDKYRVIVNDGHERVREGDIIVWDRGTYGHVGVVIKTARQKNGKEYISVAHQNGGTGNHADPIGMTLQVVDKVIKNIRNGSNSAPIFTTSTKISHFIRVYNENEEMSSYSSSMTASTTYLRFGKRDVGTSYTRKFTITNRGYSPLTISSMSPVKGEAFSIDVSSCILNPGETREFHVTFSPTQAGDYEDRIIIRSNADDNPRWLIKLLGIGKEPENSDGRQLMLSKNVHGTEYRLYKQIIDENDTRINPDGSIYYRTQLTLDVIKSSNTETYVVDSDVYHDPQHGGQQPAMLFDLISNQLHIFYNSKIEGNNYRLNGYNYVTSLNDINFNKETVFSTENWGWFPFYEYNNGQIIIHHFSYNGYYYMKSIRNNGSWSNNRLNKIQPDAFAQLWEQAEHVLVVEPEKENTQGDYVDLGLPSGTLWATCNVGASAPEEYGDYFAWGETGPNDYYNKFSYKWWYYDENGHLFITKYCTDSEWGTVDNKTELDLEDDAAYVNWGPSWRMPSREQIDELLNECTWEMTTRNGVIGDLVTGPNGKMLFFPTAGYIEDSSSHEVGEWGMYWSRTLNNNSNGTAYWLYFNSGLECCEANFRYGGFSVRPVRVSQKNVPYKLSKSDEPFAVSKTAAMNILNDIGSYSIESFTDIIDRLQREQHLKNE